MAVVQLKFDQKGKYSYSAIANINQSHKQQLIEIHSPITNGHATYANNNESHNGEQKNDLITNNAKSEVVSPTNGRQYNGVNHSSSNNCTSPSKNGKVCLCELKFREKRKRSESIKVENWDFIYKEKAFRTNIDPPLCDDHNALPKWVLLNALSFCSIWHMWSGFESPPRRKYEAVNYKFYADSKMQTCEFYPGALVIHGV